MPVQDLHRLSQVHLLMGYVLTGRLSVCLLYAEAFLEVSKRLKARIWASDAGKQKGRENILKFLFNKECI